MSNQRQSIADSPTTIDAPGSTYTYANGINADGVVTGIYDDASLNAHGFLRGMDGAWISFNVPGNNFGLSPRR
jgi:hypothetical protein